MVVLLEYLLDGYSNQRLWKRGLSGLLVLRPSTVIFCGCFGNFHYRASSADQLLPIKVDNILEAMLIARKTLCQLDRTAATANHRKGSVAT